MVKAENVLKEVEIKMESNSFEQSVCKYNATRDRLE